MAHSTIATAWRADDYATPHKSSPSGVQVAPFKFTVTAALLLNDLILLSQLAQGNSPGYILIGFIIEVPDLDTATALLFDVGDSTSATRYVASSVAGQAPGRISSFGTAAGAASVIAGTLPQSYTAQDDLILKVHTAAGTPVTSGVICGSVFYAQLGISSL